ncbi:hypothetical protein PHYBOEH_003243 [Phytophthora boehmeriae]|uniref:BRCT domain-containing protein n=1 Tax=Phytophthora boehmeriae TaxID=109152 RepID=A0A8T1X9S5_9STRA|nr:hypothetical protein PHYBOEH_003243 [Phytophthora boehmeriae]
MESPQPPARPPPSPTASCQSDAAFLGANDSFQPENDSFSSSQQCSADPNAFLGFHVAPSAENVELEASQTLDTPKKTEKRLQLVLDLEVREQGATRGPDFEPIVASSQSESQAEMRNQFSDLFAKDTQDEEQVAPQAFSPLKNQDMARDKAPPSPPPTILKDVESARKAKIRQVAAAEEKKQEIDEELAVGASGLSEYSEDLAPNCFQAAFTASLSSLDAEAKSAMITEGNSSDKADESDRETNFEDEMECTQALDEDDGAESECVTRVDDTGTEAYSLSDAGTQPYDFTFNDDDDKMEGEQKDDADITCCEESEDTSGDGSQIKVSDGKLDYLTPRANVTRVEKPAAGNATSEVTAPIHRDDNEPELDDDRDEYTATQPSEDCATDEPLEEPTSSADENSLKKGDNTARDKRVGAADSQTKAIRALEFSFTSTGSHENEVQFDSSLSGSMTLTSNTNTSLPRSAEANPFETSISPVCAPTPTPVDDSCTPEDIILHIFEGYSFGIVCNTVARDKVNLYKFILEACGADAVDEEISIKGHNEVDIVLCDEYTKVCQYYEKKRNVPVKDFQWITECMILQRFLDPDEPGFEPQRVGRKSVSAASAEIGDSEKMRLKLHTGELVLADVSGNDVDHFLLYNVCEIMSIHVNGRVDDGEVMLRVGILKRDPYSTGLYKIHTRIVDIPASQVKRRVLAVSKEAFDNFGYRDESIFYFENEDEDESQDVVGQQPPHR